MEESEHSSPSPPMPLQDDIGPPHPFSMSSNDVLSSALNPSAPLTLPKLSIPRPNFPSTRLSSSSLRQSRGYPPTDLIPTSLEKKESDGERPPRHSSTKNAASMASTTAQTSSPSHHPTTRSPFSRSSSSSSTTRILRKKESSASGVGEGEGGSTELSTATGAAFPPRRLRADPTEPPPLTSTESSPTSSSLLIALGSLGSPARLSHTKSTSQKHRKPPLTHSIHTTSPIPGGSAPSSLPPSRDAREMQDVLLAATPSETPSGSMPPASPAMQKGGTTTSPDVGEEEEKEETAPKAEEKPTSTRSRLPPCVEGRSSPTTTTMTISNTSRRKKESVTEVEDPLPSSASPPSGCTASYKKHRNSAVQREGLPSSFGRSSTSNLSSGGANTSGSSERSSVEIPIPAPIFPTTPALVRHDVHSPSPLPASSPPLSSSHDPNAPSPLSSPVERGTVPLPSAKRANALDGHDARSPSEKESDEGEANCDGSRLSHTKQERAGSRRSSAPTPLVPPSSSPFPPGNHDERAEEAIHVAKEPSRIQHSHKKAVGMTPKKKKAARHSGAAEVRIRHSQRKVSGSSTDRRRRSSGGNVVGVGMAKEVAAVLKGEGKKGTPVSLLVPSAIASTPVRERSTHDDEGEEVLERHAERSPNAPHTTKEDAEAKRFGASSSSSFLHTPQHSSKDYTVADSLAGLDRPRSTTSAAVSPKMTTLSIPPLLWAGPQNGLPPPSPSDSVRFGKEASKTPRSETSPSPSRVSSQGSSAAATAEVGKDEKQQQKEENDKERREASRSHTSQAADDGEHTGRFLLAHTTPTAAEGEEASSAADARSVQEAEDGRTTTTSLSSSSSSFSSVGPEPAGELSPRPRPAVLPPSSPEELPPSIPPHPPSFPSPPLPETPPASSLPSPAQANRSISSPSCILPEQRSTTFPRECSTREEPTEGEEIGGGGGRPGGRKKKGFHAKKSTTTNGGGEEKKKKKNASPTVPIRVAAASASPPEAPGSPTSPLSSSTGEAAEVLAVSPAHSPVLVSTETEEEEEEEGGGGGGAPLPNVPTADFPTPPLRPPKSALPLLLTAPPSSRIPTPPPLPLPSSALPVPVAHAKDDGRRSKVPVEDHRHTASASSRRASFLTLPHVARPHSSHSLLLTDPPPHSTPTASSSNSTGGGGSVSFSGVLSGRGGGTSTAATRHFTAPSSPLLSSAAVDGQSSTPTPTIVLPPSPSAGGGGNPTPSSFPLASLPSPSPVLTTAATPSPSTTSVPPSWMVMADITVAYQSFILRLPGQWMKPILRALALQVLTEHVPLLAITSHAIHDAFLDLMGETLHTRHWCKEDAGAALSATSYVAYLTPSTSSSAGITGGGGGGGGGVRGQVSGGGGASYGVVGNGGNSIGGVPYLSSTTPPAGAGVTFPSSSSSSSFSFFPSPPPMLSSSSIQGHPAPYPLHTMLSSGAGYPPAAKLHSPSPPPSSQGMTKASSSGSVGGVVSGGTSTTSLGMAPLPHPTSTPMPHSGSSSTSVSGTTNGMLLMTMGGGGLDASDGGVGGSSSGSSSHGMMPSMAIAPPPPPLLLTTTLDTAADPRVNLLYLSCVGASLLRFHTNNLRQLFFASCKKNIEKRMRDEYQMVQQLQHHTAGRGGGEYGDGGSSGGSASTRRPAPMLPSLSLTEMAIAATKQLNRGLAFGAHLAQHVPRTLFLGSNLFVPRVAPATVTASASFRASESVTASSATLWSGDKNATKAAASTQNHTNASGDGCSVHSCKSGNGGTTHHHHHNNNNSSFSAAAGTGGEEYVDTSYQYASVSFEIMPSIFLKFKMEQRRIRQEQQQQQKEPHASTSLTSSASSASPRRRSEKDRDSHSRERKQSNAMSPTAGGGEGENATTSSPAAANPPPPVMNSSAAFSRTTPYFQAEFIATLALGNPSSVLFASTLAPEFFVGMSTFLAAPMRALISALKATLHRLYNAITNELMRVNVSRDFLHRLKAPPLELSLLYIRESRIYFTATPHIAAKLFFATSPDSLVVVPLEEDRSHVGDVTAGTVSECMGYSTTAYPAGVVGGDGERVVASSFHPSASHSLPPLSPALPAQKSATGGRSHRSRLQSSTTTAPPSASTVTTTNAGAAAYSMPAIKLCTIDLKVLSQDPRHAVAGGGNGDATLTPPLPPSPCPTTPTTIITASAKVAELAGCEVTPTTDRGVGATSSSSSVSSSFSYPSNAQAPGGPPPPPPPPPSRLKVALRSGAPVKGGGGPSPTTTPPPSSSSSSSPAPPPTFFSSSLMHSIVMAGEEFWEVMEADVVARLLLMLKAMDDLAVRLPSELRRLAQNAMAHLPAPGSAAAGEGGGGGGRGSVSGAGIPSEGELSPHSPIFAPFQAAFFHLMEGKQAEAAHFLQFHGEGWMGKGTLMRLKTFFVHRVQFYLLFLPRQVQGNGRGTMPTVNTGSGQEEEEQWQAVTVFLESQYEYLLSQSCMGPYLGSNSASSFPFLASPPALRTGSEMPSRASLSSPSEAIPQNGTSIFSPLRSAEEFAADGAEEERESAAGCRTKDSYVPLSRAMSWWLAMEATHLERKQTRWQPTWESPSGGSRSAIGGSSSSSGTGGSGGVGLLQRSSMTGFVTTTSSNSIDISLAPSLMSSKHNDGGGGNHVVQTLSPTAPLPIAPDLPFSGMGKRAERSRSTSAVGGSPENGNGGGGGSHGEGKFSVVVFQLIPHRRVSRGNKP